MAPTQELLSEEPAQEARYGEDEMAMRDGREGFVLQPLGPGASASTPVTPSPPGVSHARISWCWRGRPAYGFRLFRATKAPPFRSHRRRMSMAKRMPVISP